MMLVKEMQREIPKDRIELLVLCWAFESPNTTPKDKQSSNNVTENVSSFLLII